MQRQDLARRNRQEAERKLKELQERQARLEAEINALYPIPSRIRKEAWGEIL
jgi:cell division protein FtsB